MKTSNSGRTSISGKTECHCAENFIECLNCANENHGEHCKPKCSCNCHRVSYTKQCQHCIATSCIHCEPTDQSKCTCKLIWRAGYHLTGCPVARRILEPKNAQPELICPECYISHCKHCRCPRCKPTDQKPIWEEEFTEEFGYLDAAYKISASKTLYSAPKTIPTVDLKQFISQVEKAAYERGKHEGFKKGYREATEASGIKL